MTFLTRLLLIALLALPTAQAAPPDRTLALVDDTAATEKRVALVIGNAAYKETPLKNPVHDARAMAAKLRGLGFDVIEKHNLNQRQIGATLREFRTKLTPGGTALFFYAGHGLQVGGVNYLPAVDADIGGEEDVPTQAIDVNKVLGVMETSKTRVNLVFLDACRNNPYARSFRSAGEGLAKISAPSGSLIFYATRPGSVAADGEGQNGLYTQNLLAAMDVPGLTVEQVQKRVASGVRQGSRGRQEPWMEGLLEGEFYFRRGEVPALAPQRPPSATLIAAPSADPAEASYWAEVTRLDDAESYAAYITAYPNGLYVADANEYLERDKRNKEAKAQLKEDQAWSKAQEGNSYASYGGYLKAWPAGRYAPLAKLKQSKLHPARQPFEPETVAIPGKDYQMGKYEVTVGQFTAFVNDSGHDAGNRCWIHEGGKWKEHSGRNWRNPGFSQGDDHPVACINWDDVQAYLQWLSRKTGKGYRLPKEDEWKHACDGGNSQEYCGSGSVDAVVWYGGNSGNKTHPVGQKQANGYGLHDMSGNVWEWQQDCWEGDCSRRVLRGGSWANHSENTRAAFRHWDSADARSFNNGFRVVVRSARTD